MRQIASCLGEYAIQVSDQASCSTSSTHSWISPNQTPSILTSVASLHKTTLSNQKHLLITATWTKTHTAQGLTISFGPNPSPISFKLNTGSTLFRKKKKGTKLLEFETSKIELSWDLSGAKYNAGRPEPIDGFHVSILVDSELALVLGNEVSVSKNLQPGTHVAKSHLVSRREYFSGNTLYTTKARFCEGGILHDVLIHCDGETEGLKCPVLSVCIDKKTVVKVKRLQWNFRGNQTVFLDGLLVDMMWDVHDWFFGGSGPGLGVFMFRRRSGTESRLWLEEKGGKKEMQEKSEFSLVIYACMND
ncbi:hypothetical protein Vadar_015965 [Vaccinium darrowii]|uniref:Uncharacterized protein n=1 Tax=Vaccinium darrowii TaxID=229202 RepID=A0ACB7ZBF2_9ERIC|nr:hypothetical protein Vadar_015965 [Vaccinium darrowii]